MLHPKKIPSKKISDFGVDYKIYNFPIYPKAPYRTSLNTEKVP